MRIKLHFGFRRLVTCLLAGVITTGAWADPDAPMFADYNLNVKSTTYSWVSAWEDGTYHYDTYQDGATAAIITLTGAISYPSLATVVGDYINGHLNSGSYYDNYTLSEGSGFYSMAGYPFTDFSNTYTNSPNLSSSTVYSSSTGSYWGPNGTYNEATDIWGQFTWSLNVYGSETRPSPQSSVYSAAQYGVNFSYDFSDYSFAVSKSGDNSSTLLNWDTVNWTDHFNGADGAWLTISYSSSVDSTLFVNEFSSASLWTPFLGSTGSSSYNGSFPGLSSLTWGGRSAATFAPAQIWVKDKEAPATTRKLLTWQSGEITEGGNIIDVYGTGDLKVFIEGGPAGGNEVRVNVDDNGEYDEETGFTNTGDYEILTAQSGTMAAWIDDEPFFNASTSLWVDGTEYPFREGYEDDSGTRVDVYANPSAGTVTLIGSTSDATVADVQINHMSVGEDGSYDDGDFITYIFLVTTEASTPVYGPMAWWVDGRRLTRAEPGGSTYTDGTDSITVSSSDSGATLDLTGTVGSVSITGSVSGTAAGFVFMDNTAVSATTVAVARANWDGSLILGIDEPPENFPPAVMAFGQGLWRFMGSATVEDVTTGYYARAAATSLGEPADARVWLLAVDSEGAATLTNLVTDDVFSGAYSTTTHLFQTTSGEEDVLPVRLVAVDSATGAVWGLGELPEGLPPSLRVRGQPWWYAGTDGEGNAIYQGFYSGQAMTVGALENGARLVSLVDPVHNAGASNPFQPTSGSLSEVRGSARLRDGTLVTTGNEAGEAVPTEHVDEYEMYTIAADLDVVGNNISFGVVPDDASIAGAVFQFNGSSTQATLHSILGRAEARWGWWKAGATESDPVAPVMWLDEAHKLKLYPSGSSAAAIVLDPAGNSSFKQPVRVPAGGDIPMGAYQEGSAP